MIGAPSVTDLNKVCLVIDLEGFHVSASRGNPKQFLVRELGWCAWPGHAHDVGSYRYFNLREFRTLLLKDQKTCRYVSKHIHGLPYRPTPEEQARPPWQLREDLRNLYNLHRTPERPSVAYKGGHVEKNLLDKMGIPCVDLEVWGCPKFENLNRLTTVGGCGHHADPLRHHCPQVETYHFVQWIRRTLHLPRDINFVNLERALRMAF